MPQSIRAIYKGMTGTTKLNFNWPPINANSAVCITAGEWGPVGGISGPLVGRHFIGAAQNIYVSNIGPHGSATEAGGVEFCLHVNYPQPLFVAVDITVLDAITETVGANF